MLMALMPQSMTMKGMTVHFWYTVIREVQT
jgi:hypothetical protein